MRVVRAARICFADAVQAPESTVPTRVRVRLAVLAVTVLLGACSEPGHSSVEFCDKLVEVTGPDGTELSLVPGDPARIDGVTEELAELHERAPETISTTTRTLLAFFEDFQRAPRSERPELRAAQGDALADAAVLGGDRRHAPRSSAWL